MIARYRCWSRRYGRLFLAAHSHAVPRPIATLVAEDGAVEVALGFGTPGADPAVFAAFDLTGTRLGELVVRVAWWRK